MERVAPPERYIRFSIETVAGKIGIRVTWTNAMGAEFTATGKDLTSAVAALLLLVTL